MFEPTITSDNFVKNDIIIVLNTGAICHTFQHQAQKNTHKLPRRISYILLEKCFSYILRWNFPVPCPKGFLYFPKKFF